MAPEILDAALSRPPGEAEEDDLGCGAYALWAAMTRLAHEVKLQGRSFAALRERLENDAANPDTAAGDIIGERVASVIEQALAAFRESVGEAERRIEIARRRETRAEDDLLSALTDIHDRLARSLDASRQSVSRSDPKAGWWVKWLLWRRGGSGAIDSLIEGQELALRRVKDELARRGMREIAALGERFDPEIMRAVAADSSKGIEDGTVTAVVRGGWLRDGTVWRHAEVAVARRREQEASCLKI
jgi:molecular chaperone GrpE